MKKIIIVGAGIAGLAFAYECLLHQYDVLLVENTSEVGGLARTVVHNDCCLDIGVHVLYLKDKEVREKVAEIISPEKWIQIRRNGKLYIKGRYVDWPLTLRSLVQLPFGFTLRAFRDQISKKIGAQKSHQDYESEVLALYGPTMYHSFFEPLTRKFLQTEPSKIHSDWAFSSLRAATKIEDKSFAESNQYLTQTTDAEAKKHFNVMLFLLNCLLADRDNELFYYFNDGFGALAEAYKERILGLGGRILMNKEVAALNVEQDKITKCVIDGQPHDVDELIWTGDPFNLCRLLNLPRPDLEYLHSKFVFVFLKRCLKDHQVCYYADEHLSFSRGTILSNHSKMIIRNKNVSDVICLEYTSKSEEDMNRDFSSMRPRMIKELKQTRMIEDESDIESFFEINAPRSYPVLTVDYREKLAAFKERLRRFSGLAVIGRQATFNYENADVVIKSVLHHPLFREKT